MYRYDCKDKILFWRMNEMRSTKLDHLGRVVIPVACRKALKLKENTPLSITLERGAVVIRPADVICCLCGAPLGIEVQLPLCEQCIEQVKNSDKL